MSELNKTYTYRNGNKLELDKSPEQMVVRTIPENLDDSAITDSKQVSSASTRVNTSAAKLELLMDRSRNLAPTHHAYYESENGLEFLITDRIFVAFNDALSDEQVDEFAGRYGLVKKSTYSAKDYLFQLTDHTGMNPVKLVVILMEQDSLVKVAEHNLNQRMNTYQFTEFADPEKMHKAGPNHDTALCGVICAEIDTVLTVCATAGC